MPSATRLLAAEPPARGLSPGPSSGLTVPIQLPPGVDPTAVPSLVQAVQDAVNLLAQARGRHVVAQADVLAELAVGRLEPRFELVEERVRRMHTVNTVLAETEWLSAEQINALQPEPPANRSLPASDWKRRGRIFSVSHGGRELYPRYQFDAAYQPLPVIKQVLAAFGPVADPWTLVAWFHFPNGWLVRVPPGRRASARAIDPAPEPSAPKDRLDDAAAVVHAAAQRLHGYVA